MPTSRKIGVQMRTIYFATTILVCALTCSLNLAFAQSDADKCSIILSRDQIRYVRVLVKSRSNHLRFQDEADVLEFDPQLGISANWLGSIAHYSTEYFRLEARAFENEVNVGTYLEARLIAIQTLRREFDLLSFGGLFTSFSRSLWQFQDAILEYAESEEMALANLTDLSQLFNRRYQNLAKLKEELEDLVGESYRPVFRSSTSAQGMLVIRNLWLAYVNAELSVLSEFENLK